MVLGFVTNIIDYVTTDFPVTAMLTLTKGINENGLVLLKIIAIKVISIVMPFYARGAALPNKRHANRCSISVEIFEDTRTLLMVD
jgi:hypothetical protein